MTIMIGSARSDERGRYTEGEAGDQKQNSSANDTKGEVSIQSFYVHAKGWNILRPKDPAQAGVIASKMITACNNVHIGYDQYNRLGVVKYGVETETDTECDCSSLVRQCVKEATGKDPGNFTTEDEAEALEATGLFESRRGFVSLDKTPIYNGDILVTKTKGHSVVVTSGNPRVSGAVGAAYYPKYSGGSESVVDALAAVGEKDTSYGNRKKIAAANGIAGYTGTSAQNDKMTTLLKKGALKRAGAGAASATESGIGQSGTNSPISVGQTASDSTTSGLSYYPRYNGGLESIVDALEEVGEGDTSFANRKKIAAANGITGYKGTEVQNEKMLGLLKAGRLLRG